MPFDLPGDLGIEGRRPDLAHLADTVVAVQDIAQAVEGAAVLDVRDVDVPVLMRTTWPDEDR